MLFVMENLQATNLFDVFGTTSVSLIDFYAPGDPRGAERDPRGGRGVPRVPFRHPYGRLAHPIGHRGAMIHDTVGTRVVDHGVSQATL